MRTIWSHLGNLIVVILLSPLFIILIGPFLVLAALRGYQPMGPITLNTLRYGPPGRIGGLALGLGLWFLIWGGFAWVIINGLLRPPSTIANTLSTVSPTAAAATNTATPVPPSPTSTPSPTATATAVETPLTPTPILTLTITAVFKATATPTLTPTSNATMTPTATATPTPTTVTATPTLTPTAEAGVLSEETESTDLDLVETVRPTPLPPLSSEDQETVMATIKEGNALLWAVITTTSDESIQDLKNVWQGGALEKAETFATERYAQYEQPVEVQFQYIIPPRITEQSAPDQIIVTSQERWFYRGETTIQQETFEFIYTLQREAEGWVITGYTYDAP